MIFSDDTGEVSYDYYDYLTSEHWKKFKEKYIQHYGNKCKHCGENGTNLHHINYDRLGNEDFYDVILLCNKCHYKVHRDEYNNFD